MVMQALTLVFDPTFSKYSYGFRPGKSAHDAMKTTQAYAQSGRTWGVDIDISKFFDHVNHDILMHRIAQTIRDKRVLRLIGRYLRRGAMTEGVVMTSTEGTPQGGPLSPLLANIYLDALDKELEKRKHTFCRYADDCNIYVCSESAAERVRESTTQWLKKELKLEVNEEKSGCGRVWERKLVGFRLYPADADNGSRKESGAFQEQSQRAVAELPESKQGRLARPMARLRARMGGILPPCRRPQSDIRLGTLDSAAYPSLLLAAMAWNKGTAESAETAWLVPASMPGCI
jgi:group II intron reverse transcriptase/maturase